MKCPVCDSTRISKRYVLHDRFFGVTDESFAAYGCAGCGALFLDRKMVVGRLDEFYPAHYWWAPRGFAGKLESRYREWVLRYDHLAFVRGALSRHHQPKCLEIGCGSGTFIGMARRAGLDVRGLEISTEAVAEARSQGIDWIEAGTIEDALKAGEVYDAVILFHVLEHLPNPRVFMKKLSAVIREGGALILQVPNINSFQARLLGNRWYGLDCPRHVCNYSTEALEQLLASSGFRIEKTDTFSLRDNAPALISSLLPFLDPLGRRVKALASGRNPGGMTSLFLSLVYFGLVLCAQPLAWLESLAGRGATIKLSAVYNGHGGLE